MADGAPPAPPPPGAQQPRPLTPAEKVFNRRLEAPAMVRLVEPPAGLAPRPAARQLLDRVMDCLNGCRDLICPVRGLRCLPIEIT